MVVDVLCVCRRPPAWVTETCADYAKRLARSDELRFRYLNPGLDGVDSAVRRRDEGVRISKALQESEEHFRNAFDYASIGMALVARRKPRPRRGRPSAMPRSVDRDCGA